MEYFNSNTFNNIRLNTFEPILRKKALIKYINDTCYQLINHLK